MAEPAAAPRTRNAEASINGNKAETLVCTQANVKAALEAHFGKPIRSITLVDKEKASAAGERMIKKKSDVRAHFEDGTVALFQIKTGDGGGRGHSVDRRPVTRLTTLEDLHRLLTTVCLTKSKTDARAVIPKVTSEECLDSCLLLGTRPEFRPDYFLHTALTGDREKTISKLSIIPAPTLRRALVDSLYDTMLVKRTCVHLSPYLYFQRKGGGMTDSRPDDIQLKMPLKDIFTIFTVLPLVTV